ncbi:MAG: GNAT family N-acetyltransferase, partial [Gammaproteobacteria bacterium]|nr:GNAT family N-acetyltransferase [Gammaproteobacteria bacterium]
QRQGLGTTLLKESESVIRRLGGTRVYIDTSGRAQYASTRAFYESAGYTVAADLADFYAPGDAKIVFCKRL